MKDNFFYSKTINGETHLKMLSEKDDSLTKGYSEISFEEYSKMLSVMSKNKPKQIEAEQ